MCIRDRDYIADGVLGNIYYAEIDRIRRRGVPSWGTFHRKAASGGGALADIGIHALDAMLWICLLYTSILPSPGW